MNDSSNIYEDLQVIKPELKKRDSIPLTGRSPNFPWDEFSQKLSQIFEREGIQIEASDCIWRSKEELESTFGNQVLTSTFAIPNMHGHVSLVISNQDVQILSMLLLIQDVNPHSVLEDDLTLGVYKFFVLEALYQFRELISDKKIMPTLVDETFKTFEDSLCRDIFLRYHDQTIRACLMISPEFQKSWVKHFSNAPLSPLSQSLSQNVDLNFNVKAGETTLPLKDWMEVKEGDFIILDHCFINDQTLSGHVFLTNNGRNVFKAELKDGQLTILQRS
ncbi:MAG: hypothetical protein Q8K60_04730 [Parachlamydiaceae bacterium]|nr:hypothetical protein [Parachlamydiaceae bacterium]